MDTLRRALLFVAVALGLSIVLGTVGALATIVTVGNGLLGYLGGSLLALAIAGWYALRFERGGVSTGP
jgi:hypothetical protein